MLSVITYSLTSNRQEATGDCMCSQSHLFVEDALLQGLGLLCLAGFEEAKPLVGRNQFNNWFKTELHFML